MLNPNDYSPERMADRAQIQDVIFRWCRAIDRLDYDAIRAVFHPDATDSHGIYNGGVDGLINWIRSRHQTISFSMHSVSNILIEFASPDTALVESYCFAVQRYPAEGKSSLAQLSGGVEGNATAAMDMMACGRYVDHFERRQGHWRIKRRTVVFDSTMMYQVSEDAPKMDPSWTVGKRNSEDWIYAARASVGLKAP
jgi:SnoaL-like domain